MRVPLSWLAEFVDLDRNTEKLANDLTAVGLKVEAVHRPGEQIDRVVVGRVQAIKDHPRADNLIVVDVDTGGEERRIVCGARNFAIGDHVPVALVGARLPDGTVIEQRSIKGEVSDGMLCSPRELEVSDDHTGIMVLPPASEVGDDVREVLGLNDVVFEFEIKPNRPDAMSILGVARDYAALKRSDLRVPATEIREQGAAITELTDVVVEDAIGCPRYLARVVTGVSVGPSPSSVQQRLLLAGYRPISNVVDATNYALLVLGHPLHAFDLNLLGERRIVVRRARDAEPLVTLDGEARKLHREDLVIADASQPVGIAGVIGGQGTEVSDETTDILLESAYFDPVSILRTSRRLGLRTEASARFERGADPSGVGVAADYACRLITEWAGGTVASGVIDRYPEPKKPIEVSLRPKRASALLGKRISASNAVSLLNRLGFEAVPSNGSIRTTVPTSRPDITIEADLIEEIARLDGYDSIPARLPSGRNRAGGLTREQSLLRHARRLLAAAGLWEAQTTSLIGPSDLERSGIADSALRIVNALSVEESLLRPSLLPGLLAAVSRNVARRNLSVRLFEIGHCFLSANDILPAEPYRLGLVIHGPTESDWHTPSREMDFFDLKGSIEALLEGMRVPAPTYQAAERQPFHPARAAAVKVDGREIGTIGEIAPEIGGRYDLTHRASAGELDLAAIVELAGPPQVTEAGRFPAALVDLAVEVPDQIPAAEVLETARTNAGEFLEDVRIFDVYKGEQIGEGNRSIALSLRFRHPDRTLKDSEVLGWRDAIAGAITKKLGGRIRSS